MGRTFGVTTGGHHAEAIALIAAMATPPSSGRQQAITTCIGSLKAAGVWSKLDLLYVLAAADSQAAGLNWLNPSTFALSAVSSPTFTTDRGYTGNGTSSYLDTGWDIATNGVTATLNSAHIGAYCFGTGSLVVNDFTTGTAVNNVCAIRTMSGTNGGGKVNSTSIINTSALARVAPFHMLVARRDAVTTLMFTNGAPDASASIASTSLSSSDLNFFRSNTTGFSDRSISAGHIGGGLSDADAAALYSALHAYMVSVGADT